MNGFEAVKFTKEPDNLIALKVVGKITEEDMIAFNRKLEEIVSSGKKALVYFDIAHYGGFELALVKEKFSHLSTIWNGIERIAYIVDESWMSKLIDAFDMFTPMYIKAFSHKQKEQAEQWLLNS